MAFIKTKLPSGFPKAKQNLQEIIDARDAFYLVSDPRRRQQKAYANQIGNDPTAFAGCPREGFQRFFPGRDLTGVKE